jgi:hypothetical protein
LIKRTTSLLAVVAAIVVLGGCASHFEAIYDHDSSNDFTGYKTFAWVSEHPMEVGNVARTPHPLLEQEIMVTIESGLGEKGYRLISDLDSADFALALSLGSRQEIKASAYPTMAVGYSGYGYPSHWGGWGSPYYGVGMSTGSNVRQYDKGMLAMDVFDVEERRPVWHGVATKSIKESDIKDMDGTIQAAVDAILEGFPPE